MLPDAALSLRDELIARFARGLSAALDEATFDDLALRSFRFQYEHNPPYRAYCDRRRATPDSVARADDVPAVPTAAFKQVALVAGDPAHAQAVFRTSGTTRGHEQRGTHYLLDTSLYDASLLAGFRDFLLPDGASLPILSAVPPPDDAPDSSLSYMAGAVIAHLGAHGSGFFASARKGVHIEALRTALQDARRSGRPVLIFATSLALVHVLDALRTEALAITLPAGSRIMDTGGFKGAETVMEAAALRAAYHDLLGVPRTHVVNEYGMTEMCSQMYDVSLRAPGDASQDGLKQSPPWLRTRAVDPETLAQLPHGTPGLLRHFDLANLGSVCAIQTEDVGVTTPAGFFLHGRAPGAPPRGCSIALDLLMQSVRNA
jgi:hypothetical protein